MMKSSFLCNLLSWTNLYIVERPISLLDFSAMYSRVWHFVLLCIFGLFGKREITVFKDGAIFVQRLKCSFVYLFGKREVL